MHLGKFIRLIGVVLLSQSLYAQEGAYPLIGDLQSVDWAQYDAQAGAKYETVLKHCHGGQDSLRAAITANPKDFPLHELENPEVFESDEHRRWEYQMKRMPVEVVRVVDFDDYLTVTLSGPDTVTFCDMPKATAQLSITNQSQVALQSFTIDFYELLGLNLRNASVNSKSVSGTTVQQPNPRDLRFTINQLEPAQSVIIDLAFSIDCNGKGSSPGMAPGIDQYVNSFDYLVEFTGYQLDFSRKTLYKILARNSASGDVVMQTKQLEK